ncbi:MAG: ATP-binding protein [Treponema sp.]|nr:MAG: ATP-binding protein [Treponema sp.]
MKLVLYGISCSGKDTFINTFLTEHSCFKHIHGSKRLSEISNEKYGADFQKLPAETQNNIRKAFVSELTNMNNIIVDGHYCFPKAIMSLRQFFSDEDKKIYMMYSCI